MSPRQGMHDLLHTILKNGTIFEEIHMENKDSYHLKVCIVTHHGMGAITYTYIRSIPGPWYEKRS